MSSFNYEWKFDKALSGNFHLLARQGEEFFVRVSVTGCEKKANQ